MRPLELVAISTGALLVGSQLFTPRPIPALLLLGTLAWAVGVIASLDAR